MPSGNTHTIIAIIGAGVAAGTVLMIFNPPIEQAGAVAAGIIIGDLFLSPDLDGEFSNAKRRWYLLKHIWFAYEKFPHRSPFTHWPVISDIIRIAYLAAVVLIPISIVGGLRDGVQGAILDSFWAMTSAQSLVMENSLISLPLFTGLCLATLLHGTADAIVSEGKKMIDIGEPKGKKNAQTRNVQTLQRNNKRKVSKGNRLPKRASAYGH